MRLSIMLASLLALMGVLGAEGAEAHPDRIILLRHGEKTDGPQLCSVGALRAQALSDEYLGKGAPGNDIIFGKDRKPDAFFAITPHTKETATPSAQSWGEQLTAFSVDDPNAVDDLNEQTRKAAAALDSPEYDGKIVVVVWEHHRIANKELNKDNATFWSAAKPRNNSQSQCAGKLEGRELRLYLGRRLHERGAEVQVDPTGIHRRCSCPASEQWLG